MQKIVLSLLVMGACLISTPSLAATSPTPPSSCVSQLVAKYGDEHLKHIGPGEFLTPYDEPVAAGKDETVAAFCARIDAHQATITAQKAAVVAAQSASATALSKQQAAEQATRDVIQAHAQDDQMRLALVLVFPFGVALLLWLGFKFIFLPIIWPPLAALLRLFGVPIPRRRRGLGSRTLTSSAGYHPGMR